MELDEIKKIWNEIDLLKEKQQVNDNRIKEMLKNEGKSMLAKLVRLEKFGMIVLIPGALFVCLCMYKFFIVGGYYMICPLAFLLLCIILQPYQTKVYRRLKGIDFSSMTIREVSEKILKYQNDIRKWQPYTITLCFGYIGICYYFVYKLYFGSEIIWGLIIYYVILWLSMLITMPFLIKKLYHDKINKIKKSLKELEEFEQ